MQIKLRPDQEEQATSDLWDLSVAVDRAADSVDQSAQHQYRTVTLPGMPTCSLAFLLEHLSGYLDRLLGGGRHAK